MYATEFVGSLNGNVQGSVSGRAGSADKLSSPSVFRMTGDVESLLDIDFDGQQGTVTFQTQVTNEFISAKTIKDTKNYLKLLVTHTIIILQQATFQYLI